MSSRHRHFGLFLGFIGMLMFAGTVPATRLAVGHLDPLFVTVARAVIAGVAAVVMLAAMRRRLPPRALWGEQVASAVCLVYGFPGFTALALMTVPAAHGGVVLGIMPLATAAAAALFAGERPSMGFWLAGLAGTGLVVVFALHRGRLGTFASGDLLFLGSIASGAIGYTLSAKLTRQIPGWEVISWSCAICLPPSAIACWLTWPSDVAAVPVSAWGAVVFVGLFPQFLSFFAWNKGLALGGIARVGQVLLLQTFAIIALAALVNGETIDVETIVFAAAVVATVLIGQRMRVAR